MRNKPSSMTIRVSTARLSLIFQNIILVLHFHEYFLSVFYVTVEWLNFTILFVRLHREGFATWVWSFEAIIASPWPWIWSESFDLTWLQSITCVLAFQPYFKYFIYICIQFYSQTAEIILTNKAHSTMHFNM